MEHRRPRRRTPRALLGSLVASTVGAGALLVLATPGTVAAARASGADAPALVAALALAGAWVLVARLALLALATGAALLPGAAGRAAAGLAVRVAPSLLRNALVVALGTTAVVPAVAGAASAATPPPDLPRLDRVVSWLGPASPAEPLPRQQRPAAPPRPPTARAAGDVVVAPGDTLWSIAASHLPAHHTLGEVARAWPRWYARNRAVVGPDPGLLHAGQRLVAPTPSEAEP